MRASTATPASTVLLTLVLYGCGVDGPTGPVLEAPTLNDRIASHPVASPRLLKGLCRSSYAEPPVLEFPVVRQVSVGRCLFTQLGVMRQHTVQEINVVTGGALSEITFTTADGSLLRAGGIGTGTPAGSRIRFVAVSTITGGTGRFASATGTLDVRGMVSTATGDATISYRGRITY